MKLLMPFLCFLTCNILSPFIYSEDNKDVVYEIKQEEISNNIRRHFIIAIDISGAFVTKIKYAPEVKEALIHLFQNKLPAFSISDNSKNIINESNNGTVFFDPILDEISYFQFGITELEMESLRLDKYRTSKKTILRNFKKSFITDKKKSWRELGITIPEYFRIAFNEIPEKGFGDGVTLSNYVYPLVLESISDKHYAQEYILIIVSDFLTGSEFGNNNDFLRIRDIYRYNYNDQLPKYSAPFIIKEHIDKLSGAFYPINYFEYAFRSKKNTLGLIAYKIKPKAGKLSPEDISVFVDGNLQLKQKGYQSDEFDISPSQLRFIHNEKLNIEKLSLSIKTNLDSASQSTYNFAIGEFRENSGWYSPYSESDLLMQLDSTSMSYTIPKLENLSLKKQHLGQASLAYTANANYNPFPELGNGLNYTFQTTRNIESKDIIYKSKTSLIMITYIIPSLLVLGICLLLIVIARPKRILLKMDAGVNDSFEEINYKNDSLSGTKGKQMTPYLRWNDQKEDQVFSINGILALGNPLFGSLWKNKIYIKIIQEKSAPGYEIHLNNDNESISGQDHYLKVNYSKNGDFDFFLELKKVDTFSKVDSRIKFKFVLQASYEKLFLFFSKSLKSNLLKYSFYIGPELENHWIGIDPGTTGSCIAAGADGYGEIFIPKTSEGDDLIIPSMLTFLTNVNQEELTGGTTYKDVIYFYGESALKNSSRVQFAPKTFRSIKKLLGFTDKIKIAFTKQPFASYEFGGKELCSLLVKGIYQELSKAVVKTNKKELLVQGEFNPKRAVVAIPNNFTAQKTQDIIDSVKSLQQFEEIRCIYEAEANLMYYIFGVKKIVKDTTVLLFDMGGATINATVASIKGKNIEGQTTYVIDILGKLGYGIGGDTIDYVIINFLSKHLSSLGIYVDPFDFSNDFQLKEKLVTLALDIKKEIIKNYTQKSTQLIDNIKLGSFINSAFSSEITIGAEDEIMRAFTKQSNGNYSFFEDPDVKSLLFDNVRTVVQDILAVSATSIDQVIFSGRSVVFPKIQETVLSVFGTANTPDSLSLPIDELKSAVAKGACLYGTNRTRVQLNSVKINSWFAVKHTTSATGFELIKLIPLGASYPSKDEEIKKIKERKTIESDFGLDGGMVNFYQIMGANPIHSLQNKEKHKYNLLQQVRIDSKSEGVGIEVWENDDVICEVKEKGATKEKSFSTLVGDHEVGDANDKHYTWIIK